MVDGDGAGVICVVTTKKGGKGTRLRPYVKLVDDIGTTELKVTKEGRTKIRLVHPFACLPLP